MEDFLRPRLEGLLLSIELVTARDVDEPLTAQFTEQIVQVFAEGAIVRIRTRAQGEHSESDRSRIVLAPPSHYHTLSNLQSILQLCKLPHFPVLQNTSLVPKSARANHK